MAWRKNSSLAISNSVIEKPLGTEHEPVCQLMCGALNSSRIRQMRVWLATRRAPWMICSSSVFGEVGLLHTPSTVSSWYGWGIGQATTSTKDETVLKSKEKQRGKNSDFTRRVTSPPRLPLGRSLREILQFSKETSESVTSEFSRVSVIPRISTEKEFISNLCSPNFGTREQTLAGRASSFL